MTWDIMSISYRTIALGIHTGCWQVGGARVSQGWTHHLARQFATAAAIGVAQRCHLVLWGSVTRGVTWWRSDPTDMVSIITIV